MAPHALAGGHCGYISWANILIGYFLFIYYGGRGEHSIIQIHNSLMWTNNISKNILIFLFILKLGKYMEIFCRILSVPHDIGMDLNNVMRDEFMVYSIVDMC